jgi:Glycosyltransferase
MNILFLTLLEFESLQERNIYTDLLREFIRNGHEIYAISPAEKRRNIEAHLVKEDHATDLRLQIGNTQKTNIIEKGISTVMIEPTFKKAIKKYFSDVKFDMVLYSTPPITLVSAIEYLKKRDCARTYLLLKDIFPQNAVDIGIMSKTGIKGLLYKHFRRQEKKLYKISDRIGCMSQANVDYVIKHNPEFDSEKVEVCPNSIEVIDKSVDAETRKKIREKYNIPLDKKAFVYGGNLGKPQGIPFLIECLKRCSDIEDVYFLIVGDGTEYGLLENYTKESDQKNLKLMKRLPKEDYDTMVGACDVGMIFLDHRFTIPNFPSRLLSYMQAKLPVLAVTDSNTDIGKVIADGGFGWWCESNNTDGFRVILQMIRNYTLSPIGNIGYQYLLDNYSAEISYQIIINRRRRKQ